MITEFSIEQITAFVAKGYRSVAARMTKSAMDHLDNQIETNAPPVKVNMERGAILEGITHRILSERRKHQDTMPGPDAWAKIASHKIVSEHIDHLLAKEPGMRDFRNLVDIVWNFAFEDTSVPATSVADKIIGQWLRMTVPAPVTEPIKPIMSRLSEGKKECPVKNRLFCVYWNEEENKGCSDCVLHPPLTNDNECCFCHNEFHPSSIMKICDNCSQSMP